MGFSKFYYRLTHWETWHYLVKYIPLTPAWLWYCLRSGSFWFFTSSNPTITFGGFEGESKKEIYDQLPPGSYPVSIFVSPAQVINEVTSNLKAAGLSYPLAAKPDVGMMGLMFRIISNDQQLECYHNAMPVTYIIQQLVNYPLEVSVFYYRYPGQNTGHITGFLKKEFLQVHGNGHATLLELIKADPRAQLRLDEMISKHQSSIHKVIADGEPFVLSYALNLSRGGRLISLAHEKDNRLLKVMDELNLCSKHFYYGRYDIKCASVEDLKNGKNYSILEYNGSGAEPHHIYGNGNTLFQAYRIVLTHWKILSDISRINHRSGIRYWTYRKGAKFLKAAKLHFAALKKLDHDFEVI